jgi:hypothetical protein
MPRKLSGYVIEIVTAVGCDEHGLLCCNAVHFGDIPLFRGNMSLPSSGSKAKVLLFYLLALPFDPEDRDDTVTCLWLRV